MHRKSYSLDQPRDKEFLATVYENSVPKYKRSCGTLFYEFLCDVYSVLVTYVQKTSCHPRSSCQNRSCENTKYQESKIWDAYKNEKHPFGFS